VPTGYVLSLLGLQLSSPKPANSSRQAARKRRSSEREFWKKRRCARARRPTPRISARISMSRNVFSERRRLIFAKPLTHLQPRPCSRARINFCCLLRSDLQSSSRKLPVTCHKGRKLSKGL